MPKPGTRATLKRSICAECVWEISTDCTARGWLRASTMWFGQVYVRQLESWLALPSRKGLPENANRGCFHWALSVTIERTAIGFVPPNLRAEIVSVLMRTPFIHS